MKYLFSILFLISCSVFFGCTTEVYGDTYIYPDDAIKPSQRELFFSAEGGIDSVITEGENWYIEPSIRVNFVNSLTPEPDIEFKLQGHSAVTIKGSWFTVDKPDKQKIIFSVEQNETGEKRTFFIFIKDSFPDKYGNCYTHIKVNQSDFNP